MQYRHRQKGCTSQIFSLLMTLLIFTGIGTYAWYMAGSPSIEATVRAIQNMIVLGSRQVQGEVVIFNEGGDGQAPTLLIQNIKFGSIIPDFEDRDGTPVFWSKVSLQDNEWGIEWETDVGTLEAHPERQLIFDNDTIYINVDDHLRALRQTNGELLWEATLSDLVTARCFHCIQKEQDSIIVLSTDQVLQVLDASTGEIRWQTRLNNKYASALSPEGYPFVVIGSDILIVDKVSSEDSTQELRFYNIKDGNIRKQLSPKCPNPDNSIDEKLGRQTPILVDKQENKLYMPMFNQVSATSCVQSWDLNTDTISWETLFSEESRFTHDLRGGFYINPTGPYVLLKDKRLYITVSKNLSTHEIVRIDLDSGDIHPTLAMEDFSIMPLGEQDGVLTIYAKRTRGSKRSEIWGVDPDSHEKLWQHQLQSNALLNIELGIEGEWVYRFTPHGLVIIELDDDTNRIQAQLIAPSTGEILYTNSAELDNDYWAAATWNRNTAYLTLRNLYTVDLETGNISWEWP